MVDTRLLVAASCNALPVYWSATPSVNHQCH